MKQLETLDNKALVSSTLYYDKEELDSFINLFDKVEIIDNELNFYLGAIRSLSVSGKLDKLPKTSKERRARLEKLIETKISVIPESIKREKTADWFNKVKEYECDIELSEELLYRYCWAEFVHRVELTDKSDISFQDKLAIHPVVPEFSKNKKIVSLGEIEISKETSNAKIFPTGIPALDDIVKMKVSNFVIIAARTSVGKSLFLLNQAIYNARNQKVLFISLEESKEEIKMRVDKHMINRTEEERAKISENLKIFVAESSNPEIILADAEKALKEEGIDIMFLDYIQLLNYPGMNQFDSLRVLTRELKLYAIKNNVLVVTASQQKRDAETMGASNTTLFGSSTLEADANIIIILEQIRKQNVRTNDKTAININVSKNRGGSQAIIEATIDYSVGHIY